MKKIVTALFLLCVIFSNERASAQGYWASAGEMIFSLGTVDAPSVDITPVMRWSPVFNGQVQYHYDFSEKAGIYTGLGIRNVGLISRIKYNYTDLNGNTLQKDTRIKERAYGLGLPVALKVGNMNGVSIAAGGEAELMFAYKRKVMEDNNKLKKTEWFSDNVNLFNPSVYGELKFKTSYIRFKYYLLDFLDYQGVQMLDGTIIADYGPESPLWYISIGSVNLFDEIEEFGSSTNTSAYFKNKQKQKKAAAASAQVSLD